MNLTRLITATATALLLASSALALPPEHGGAGNAGVNPAVNGAEALQSCLNACAPHCTNPQLCRASCAKAVHPIGQLPPGALVGIPPDAVSCAIDEAGAWAWYGTCTYLISKGVAVASPAVAQALDGVISGTALASVIDSNSVLKQAVGLADPCGYVRDQMIKNYMSMGCPASQIFKSLGLPSSLVPKQP